MADDAQPPLPAPDEAAPSTTHGWRSHHPPLPHLEGFAVEGDAGSSTDEHALKAAADASGCAMPASAYRSPPRRRCRLASRSARTRRRRRADDGRRGGRRAHGLRDERRAAAAAGPGPPGYGGESPVYHSGYGEGGVAPPRRAGPAMMMGGYGGGGMGGPPGAEAGDSVRHVDGGGWTERGFGFIKPDDGSEARARTPAQF